MRPPVERALIVGGAIAVVLNAAANLVTALTLIGEMRHWWDVL